jgi:hypothetical protein
LNLTHSSDLNYEISHLKAGSNPHLSIRPYKYDSIYQSFVDHERYSKQSKELISGDLFSKGSPEKLHFVLNPVLSAEHNYFSGKKTGFSGYAYGIQSELSYNRFFSIHFSFARYNEDQHILYQNETDSLGLRIHYGDINHTASSNNWNIVSSYLSVNPVKDINLRAGYGKNFLGYGYRSLFYSDHAPPNIYAMGSVEKWKIKYLFLVSLLDDIQTLENPVVNKRKYSAVHYLSYNATSWLNLSFYENVIWAAHDSLYDRGFDINYLNPLAFFRPVEFSLGSYDNAMLGMGAKINITPSLYLYSQFLIDEFKLDKIKDNSGWWANKFAYQTGVKYIKEYRPNRYLINQLEYNSAKPFTYSHNSTGKNFGHYYHPMAHPLGANFNEIVQQLQIVHDKWHFTQKLMVGMFASDSINENQGNNIFKTYNTRSKEYDNYMLQGIRKNLIMIDLNIAYTINPDWHMKLTGGITYRQLSGEDDNDQFIFYGGIRTAVFNRYRSEYGILK